MQQHFVTFYSPGTFMAEVTEQPIDSWDIETAKTMAKSITERYNAKPYAFKFSTRERGDADLDSKVVARSGYYYLGGRVETLAELVARNDPADKTLIANMQGNGWDRVITTTTGWKWTQPLLAGDVVL